MRWPRKGLQWRRAERAGDMIAERALRMAAEVVLADASQEVPLEEGTLLRSGGTAISNDGREAVVYFDTPYAAVQHERMDLRHDAGRKAKYLEDPLHANSDTFLKIVKRAIEGTL